MNIAQAITSKITYTSENIVGNGLFSGISNVIKTSSDPMKSTNLKLT